MTLWEIITGNSSLPVQVGNNFWDHLTHQSGGDIFVGPLLTAEIVDEQLSANINDSMTAEIVTEQLSANCDDELTATINDDNLEANICQ